MSKIEWTDATWNPVIGCTRVSPGCEHCYAERMTLRLEGMAYARGDCAAFEKLAALTTGAGSRVRWTGKLALYPERLEQPLHWRKPRRVFVNSMSDLFHEDVPDEFIDDVFAVMALCGTRRTRCFRRECDHEGFDCETGGASPQLQPVHTFQILTKRPERLREYIQGAEERVGDATTRAPFHYPDAQEMVSALGWPLPNVHLYVSCEDQKTADERIPVLLETPAAVRGVSLEPLLGPIDLRTIVLGHLRENVHGAPLVFRGPRAADAVDAAALDALVGAYKGRIEFDEDYCWTGEEAARLDHVIVGGESGPGARPCNVEWIRSIVQQCREAKVSVFVKQLGAKPYEAHGEMDYCCSRADEHPGKHPFGFEGGDGITRPLQSRKGGDPAEWPEDLRIREWPRVA